MSLYAVDPVYLENNLKDMTCLDAWSVTFSKKRINCRMGCVGQRLNYCNLTSGGKK